MKQYLNKESDTWNIELVVNVPVYSSKKEFNFRIKNIKTISGETISDPVLSSSKYIFSIKNNMLGKKMFFNFKFSTRDISNIKSFTFGFCDEMVKWLSNTLFTCENEFLNTIKLEENITNENIVLSIESIDNNTQVLPSFEQILFIDEESNNVNVLQEEILLDSDLKKDLEIKVEEIKDEVKKVNLLENKKYGKKSKSKSKI